MSASVRFVAPCNHPDLWRPATTLQPPCTCSPAHLLTCSPARSRHLTCSPRRALPTNPSVAPNTPPTCSQVAAAAAAEVAEEETGGEGWWRQAHSHITRFPFSLHQRSAVVECAKAAIIGWPCHVWEGRGWATAPLVAASTFEFCFVLCTACMRKPLAKRGWKSKISIVAIKLVTPNAGHHSYSRVRYANWIALIVSYFKQAFTKEVC